MLRRGARTWRPRIRSSQNLVGNQIKAQSHGRFDELIINGRFNEYGCPQRHLVAQQESISTSPLIHELVVARPSHPVTG